MSDFTHSTLTSPRSPIFSDADTSSSQRQSGSEIVTSDEEPDLGAFTTVLRAWGYLQPPIRIPAYFPPSSSSRTTSTITGYPGFGGSETGSEVTVEESTVWNRIPIQSYFRQSYGNGTGESSSTGARTERPEQTSQTPIEYASEAEFASSPPPSPASEGAQTVEIASDAEGGSVRSVSYEDGASGERLVVPVHVPVAATPLSMDARTVSVDSVEEEEGVSYHHEATPTTSPLPLVNDNTTSSLSSVSPIPSSSASGPSSFQPLDDNTTISRAQTSASPSTISIMSYQRQMSALRTNATTTSVFQESPSPYRDPVQPGGTFSLLSVLPRPQASRNVSNSSHAESDIINAYYTQGPSTNTGSGVEVVGSGSGMISSPSTDQPVSDFPIPNHHHYLPRGHGVSARRLEIIAQPLVPPQPQQQSGPGGVGHSHHHHQHQQPLLRERDSSSEPPILGPRRPSIIDDNSSVATSALPVEDTRPSSASALRLRDMLGDSSRTTGVDASVDERGRGMRNDEGERGNNDSPGDTSLSSQQHIDNESHVNNGGPSTPGGEESYTAAYNLVVQPATTASSSTSTTSTATATRQGSMDSSFVLDYDHGHGHGHGQSQHRQYPSLASTYRDYNYQPPYAQHPYHYTHTHTRTQQEQEQFQVSEQQRLQGQSRTRPRLDTSTFQAPSLSIPSHLHPNLSSIQPPTHQPNISNAPQSSSHPPPSSHSHRHFHLLSSSGIDPSGSHDPEPSLGYLDEALRFIAAERVRWNAARSNRGASPPVVGGALEGPGGRGKGGGSEDEDGGGVPVAGAGVQDVGGQRQVGGQEQGVWRYAIDSPYRAESANIQVVNDRSQTASTTNTNHNQHQRNNQTASSSTSTSATTSASENVVLLDSPSRTPKKLRIKSTSSSSTSHTPNANGMSASVNGNGTGTGKRITILKKPERGGGGSVTGSGNGNENGSGSQPSPSSVVVAASSTLDYNNNHHPNPQYSLASSNSHSYPHSHSPSSSHTRTLSYTHSQASAAATQAIAPIYGAASTHGHAPTRSVGSVNPVIMKADGSVTPRAHTYLYASSEGRIGATGGDDDEQEKEDGENEEGEESALTHSKTAQAGGVEWYIDKYGKRLRRRLDGADSVGDNTPPSAAVVGGRKAEGDGEGEMEWFIDQYGRRMLRRRQRLDSDATTITATQPAYRIVHRKNPSAGEAYAPTQSLVAPSYAYDDGDEEDEDVDEGEEDVPKEEEESEGVDGTTNAAGTRKKPKKKKKSKKRKIPVTVPLSLSLSHSHSVPNLRAEAAAQSTRGLNDSSTDENISSSASPPKALIPSPSFPVNLEKKNKGKQQIIQQDPFVLRGDPSKSPVTWGGSGGFFMQSKRARLVSLARHLQVLFPDERDKLKKVIAKLQFVLPAGGGGGGGEKKKAKKASGGGIGGTGRHLLDDCSFEYSSLGDSDLERAKLGEEEADPRGDPPGKKDTLVHVFIDHSNILIGLLNHLKRMSKKLKLAEASSKAQARNAYPSPTATEATTTTTITIATSSTGSRPLPIPKTRAGVPVPDAQPLIPLPSFASSNLSLSRSAPGSSFIKGSPSKSTTNLNDVSSSDASAENDHSGGDDEESGLPVFDFDDEGYGYGKQRGGEEGSEVIASASTPRKKKSKKQFNSAIKRPPHLWHAALALVLERGRPVTRRVVVASSPLYQPMENIEQLGYELSVLTRVPDLGDGADRLEKAAKYDSYISRDTDHYSVSPMKGNLNGNTPIRSIGGSATTSTSTTTRVKYREQGVDELLQLKLLTAIAATDTVPEGATIILATGDGNVGQFNEEGYVGPVRNALKKGWKVELYAWEDGLSRSWKREFGPTSEWGKKGKFRVIAMEQFAECLVDLGF